MFDLRCAIISDTSFVHLHIYSLPVCSFCMLKPKPKYIHLNSDTQTHILPPSITMMVTSIVVLWPPLNDVCVYKKDNKHCNLMSDPFKIMPYCWI